ncbi:DUF6011 domain-containing protein [Streptomyces albus]|uniref:DUF6011 domain-containing protein n=1 Tax=Streptomyces TaxID=1883 RepID=UPI00034E752A|nr:MULTISPECIES: DUF6011 domain-containing protein [Streptomyces]EPD96745.1 hypothetical protein HMPREF1486_00604 [Streptomyces sp. HPH0547]UVN58110.1 DUF6011 domain-containing protein [Streptomyces albus]
MTGDDAAQAAGREDEAESAVLPGGEATPGRRVLCRMCGQPLRDRASRLWGLGPDCRHKLALRTAPPPPVRDVEQDPLPGL